MKRKSFKKQGFEPVRNPVAKFINTATEAATHIDRKKAMKSTGLGRRGKWLDMITLAAA